MLHIRTSLPALLCTLCLSALPASGQTPKDAGILTLDSCRTMALRQGKTMAIAALERDKAHYNRQAARANYLPKVDFMGTYQRTDKQVSILSDEQQQTLSQMGSTLVGGMQQGIATSGLPESMQQMAAQILAANPELAPLLQQGQQMASQYGNLLAGQMAETMNRVGSGIVDAFDTDTRNLGIVGVMFTQPLYMGGKIRAYDRITRYSEELAGEKLRAEEQDIILNVDKAYWQVIALSNKLRIATAYRDMLKHLDEDVLASPERVELHLGVKSRRRADVDDVHARIVAQAFPAVLTALVPPLGARQLPLRDVLHRQVDTFGTEITERGTLDARQDRHPAHRRQAPLANADEAKPDLRHRGRPEAAHRARRPEARASRHFGPCRRKRKKRRIPEKSPPANVHLRLLSVSFHFHCFDSGSSPTVSVERNFIRRRS